MLADLAYYTGLPYTTTLQVDEDGDVVARITELPGCSAHGKNNAEALENLAEAQALWIEDALDSAHHVPMPRKPESAC